MITDSVSHRLEARERALSPHAARAADSPGRDDDDEKSGLRTEFQRDRDRIVHSNAFRRLKHKTQVFIAPLGDHYVTRLTHTLEVAQIARTISRALNLNEDLTEAVALGHDLGHTPFGHVGEAELNRLVEGGFRHAEQSLRIVERLERGGRGLNLMWETRHGIANHSKPRGDFFDPGMTVGHTLEGQVCRVSDAIAYLNHDLLDAFRAGVLRLEEVPSAVIEVIGERHSQRIDNMVNDIVASSWAASGADGTHLDVPSISMGTEMREAINVLREFMFERVYEPEDRGPAGRAARAIVGLLYRHYTENPDAVAAEYGVDERRVVDYVSGMTDGFAMRDAEKIDPGISEPLGQLASGVR